MSIYLGTSEPTEIYIGTTPVNEVYVGTTKVRPSSTPPTPSSYLFYFPFISNQTDQVGNTYINATWTRWNIWYIFDTWEDTLYLWAWGSERDQTAIANCKTISVWIKWISSYGENPAVQSPSLWRWWVCYNFAHPELFFDKAFQIEIWWVWKYGGRSTTVQWTWYHLCYVDNGERLACYLNWEKKVNFSVNWRLTWEGYFLLRNARAEISEFIWDSANWTAQDVTNYWNATKTNYWYL